MPARGLFAKTQVNWINEQKSGYAAARNEGSAADFMKDFLRRYFAYFPANLPAKYEPSAEEMTAVNLDEPTPEVPVPYPEDDKSPEDFTRRINVYKGYSNILTYHIAVSDSLNPEDGKLIS